MSQKIPKRYVSEQAVKRALKIDTFRNLSKEKVMQFASMLPYMDKDVATAIINQFPVFADFGKIAVNSYMEQCDKLLESNNKSQAAVIHGYQTILDALVKRMDNPNITEDEVASITESMIEIADKIEEADLQNKKFLERMGTRIAFFALAAIAVLSAGVGVDSFISNRSGGLPQLDDETDKEDDDKNED
ncbi:MAG: hypothetical protein LUC48_11740 [Clostridiales bacterium]|nr:hypothetical protein [Clostridiales bacterium]